MKKITMMVIVAAALFAGFTAFAAEPVYDVEVSNNVGKKDIAYVTGAEAKAVISVYSEAGVLLAKKTAGNSGEVSLNIKLPSADKGKVTITVLEKGASEASTITADYEHEPVSAAPSASDVTITNNVDKKATVNVTDLEAKDIVTVYNESGKKLGSAKVGNNKDEVTINCKQLTKEAGKLLISVKSLNKLESERGEYGYEAQEVTTAPAESQIEITNNVGKKGTVVLSGMETGSSATVYSKTGKKLGSAKYNSSKEIITVSVTLDKDGGKLDIVVKEPNKLPCEAFEVNYSGQPQTDKIAVAAIEITANPSGVKDEIYIEDSSLEYGDTIKVYAEEESKSVLAKGSVNADQIAKLTKASFGTGGSTVWISSTRKGMLESDRVEVTLPSVTISKAIQVGEATDAYVDDISVISGDVTITNNAGIADVIYVEGLNEGSVVAVYSKSKNGSKLGTGTAGALGSATISISQLGKNGGSVWLSRKDSGENESEKVEAVFVAEKQTVLDGFFNRTNSDIDLISESDEDSFVYDEIDVINNAGVADSITVRNLVSGDVVKAYTTEKSSTAIATGTCGTYATSVTLSASQLGASGGYVYLTLTKSGYLESSRIKVWFDAEGGSSAVSGSQVTIDNNTGIASVMTVKNLKAGDVITVYAKETSTASIGTGTVPANGNSITLNLSSLNAIGGSVWVSRRESGYTESRRVEIEYGNVLSSSGLEAGDVKVQNNSGSSDVITVTGLNTGDLVTIYKNETNNVTIGTATANNGSVTISYPQLGSAAGTVYVTVTGAGKTESARVPVNYLGESETPHENDITVTNNVLIDSTVRVTGLSSGDTVRIYQSASAAYPIGSATAGGSEVTINVGQLSASAGMVYVSVTNYGRCESSRTEKEYEAQKTTTFTGSDISNPIVINIENNKDANAMVTVTGLDVGDCICVYDAAGTTILGRGNANGSGVTFSIGKLSESGGYVYVTRTSLGKKESAKTVFQYETAK